MSDSDIVNHPKHYTHGGIETIDYMKAKSTHEEFCGHLRLTAIKYLSRFGHKDDVLQEAQKALWYVNRLVEELRETQKDVEDGYEQEERYERMKRG